MRCNEDSHNFEAIQLIAGETAVCGVYIGLNDHIFCKQCGELRALRPIAAAPKWEGTKVTRRKAARKNA